MASKIVQYLRADPRVEDLTLDDDGWWCYLAYGIHTGESGSHLIHENSPTAVYRQLAGIRRKTHACDCEECTENLKRRETRE